MKYFFDTEFHEYEREGVNTIELISIGIVSEDNRDFYAVSKNFNVGAAFFNTWLRDNVLKPIFEHTKFHEKAEFEMQDFYLGIREHGASLNGIKHQILRYIGEDKEPQFYAYYADYDWVVFCWLFGRMIDLPKGFPMYCRDLKQILDDAVGTMPKGFDNAVYDDRAKGYTLEDLKNLPDYPKQENEHNALDDARWNKSLFDFLNSLK